MDCKRCDELRIDYERLKEDFKRLKVTHGAVFDSEVSLQQRTNNQQREIERLQKEQRAKDRLLEEKIEEISSLTKILVAKKGKNSRSKLDLDEEKRKIEDEKAATDQQLRAYKRQADDLKQQLDNQKEKHVKTSEDHQTKLDELKMQMNEKHQKQLHDAVYHLQENQRKCQYLEQQLSSANHVIAEYERRMEKINHENTMLQQRLALSMQQQQHYSSQVPQVRSDQLVYHNRVPHPQFQDYNELESEFLKDKTRRADEALRELDEMKLKTKDQPYPQYSTERYTDQASHSSSSSNTAAGQMVHAEEDDVAIPYDPNLVCPACKKQYRFGEIQKLRRHINEFCTGSADINY